MNIVCRRLAANCAVLTGRCFAARHPPAKAVPPPPAVLPAKFRNRISEVEKRGMDISKAVEVPCDTTAFLRPPKYKDRFVYDLPLDVKGCDQLAKVLPKSFVNKLLMHQKAADMDFPTIFHKLYDRFIASLVSRDRAALFQLCEKRLAEKTMQALDALQQNNLRVRPEIISLVVA